MTKRITAATTDAKFTASDAEMLRAEAEYQAYEDECARCIANVEQDYPGYCLYNYQVAEIGHDPYVLIAILEAVKPGFKHDDPDVVEMMAKLRQPRRQYTLTITKSLVPEYRDQFDGVDIDAIEPRYLELQVRFTNYDLNCVVDSILTHEQLAAYAGYLRSQGCRPDLFPLGDYPNVVVPKAPTKYHVPADRLAKYPLLAKQLKIAEPFIGYPYVWGGSDPETSFDCSGFVGYIMDKLGYNYRNTINGKSVRLPVAGSKVAGVFYDGIYDKCRPINVDNRQPGDLVFFTGTFDAAYRSANLSHLGIYLGDDMFIACSAPHGVDYQSFADLDEKGRPWGELVATYGRPPNLAEVTSNV